VARKAIADYSSQTKALTRCEGTMSEWRNSTRNFLKSAAGATAGSVLSRQALWAQGSLGSTAGSAGNMFPRIDPSLMITPDQAWKWNAFKAEAGPTYAGSVGWKRYTDFLIGRMTEFGAVDFDYVEIPYDHYIVDDWPDRRTHIYASGKALEKLVSDGIPVPVVASYGMTSGFTPPEGITAPMRYYDPLTRRRPARRQAKYSCSRRLPIRNRRTSRLSSITSR
jgi:hypothetical protein